MQLRSRPEDLNLILPDALRIDEVRSDGFTVSNVHVEGAVLLTGEVRKAASLGAGQQGRTGTDRLLCSAACSFSLLAQLMQASPASFPGDMFTLWRARSMEDMALDRWDSNAHSTLGACPLCCVKLLLPISY